MVTLCPCGAMCWWISPLCGGAEVVEFQEVVTKRWSLMEEGWSLGVLPLEESNIVLTGLVSSHKSELL